MDLLSCNNLCVSYEGRPALQDISFSVEEGDYICVLGENGAGKSTLIKTLLGLKKSESGTIEFLNGFRQKYVGYLPQQQTVKKDFPAKLLELRHGGFAENFDEDENKNVLNCYIVLGNKKEIYFSVYETSSESYYNIKAEYGNYTAYYKISAWTYKSIREMML